MSSSIEIQNNGTKIYRIPMYYFAANTKQHPYSMLDRYLDIGTSFIPKSERIADGMKDGMKLESIFAHADSHSWLKMDLALKDTFVISAMKIQKKILLVQKSSCKKESFSFLEQFRS
jgi:hypothetical protein